MIKSNFAQFKKQLDKEIEKQQKEQEDTFRKIVFTTYNSVITMSPVDKGTFRANNYIRANTPNTSTSEDTTSPSELQSNAKATLDATKVKNGTKVFITNNLPYADKLENGYSQQAPQGIYGVSEEKTRTLINRLKREVIK